MVTQPRVDVAIVGAGAAGCLFAERLAKAGKSVIVLEAGPAWTLDDLVSSQIWSRRLKWGGAPMLAEGEQRPAMNMNSGWGFGGAALHHYAVWPRLHEVDFEVRGRWGLGLDWPISYEDLRPWYDRAQAELGVSGDAEREVWRPPGEPYPMPGQPVFPHGEFLARGFEARGHRLAPTPAAITTDWYQERPPCIWDGWCDAGCPVGSLANPLIRHFPEAQKAGASFKANSPVTALLFDDDGRIDGVRHAEGDTLHDQPADLVILAGGAIQNTRLALASGLEAHGMGRYFHAHMMVMVYSLFAEETFVHLGATTGSLTSREGYDAKDDRPGEAFGSWQWLLGAALKPNDLIGIAMTRPDIMGADLHGFMERASRHIAQLGAVVETIPRPENRIELVSETDAQGVPLARTHHTIHPRSMALWAWLNGEGPHFAEAAGALESWTVPPIPNHLMGGHIMAATPEEGPCDAMGRHWDHPNLLFTGAGLFPTCGGVNPTFTLYAHGMRTAADMTEHWSDYTHG